MQTPESTITLTEERLDEIIDAAVQRALAARDEHYRELVRAALEDEALGRAMEVVEGDETVPLEEVRAELRGAT